LTGGDLASTEEALVAYFGPAVADKPISLSQEDFVSACDVRRTLSSNLEALGRVVVLAASVVVLAFAAVVYLLADVELGGEFDHELLMLVPEP
jgi:hypothetical protein